MAKLMQQYRQRMQHEHGWPVELTCPTCRQTGVPDYEGWTPSHAIRFGARSTIYANVSCPNCGVDLKAAAAEKLKELFAGVSTPPRNRLLLGWFIVCIVTAPLALAAALAAGIFAGLWTPRAMIALAVLPVVIGPAIFWMNYSIASIRSRCACGKPDYVFMGLLGRSYCYRCRHCGRMLRLRD